MSLGEFAFGIGRRIGKHPLAGRLFCLAERLLPVQRISRTEGVVAFHHPRPIADPHILVVPTRPFSSLTTNRLSRAEKADILWRMIQLVQQISEDLAADRRWQLVINGGTRQDIGQVHGHLRLADKPDSNEKTLNSPALNVDIWNTLFTDLYQAEEVPGNGYSLEISWGTGEEITVRITQSVSE